VLTIGVLFFPLSLSLLLSSSVLLLLLSDMEALALAHIIPYLSCCGETFALHVLCIRSESSVLMNERDLILCFCQTNEGGTIWREQEQLDKARYVGVHKLAI